MNHSDVQRNAMFRQEEINKQDWSLYMNSRSIYANSLWHEAHQLGIWEGSRDVLQNWQHVDWVETTNRFLGLAFQYGNRGMLVSK